MSLLKGQNSDKSKSIKTTKYEIIIQKWFNNDDFLGRIYRITHQQQT